MALLGIDVGTSGCKASLLNKEGRILDSAYLEYDNKKVQDVHGEQIDPELVWDSVKQVIRQVMTQAGIFEIDAIGVTSFGESVIFIDETGKSLADSIYYFDTRGEEQVEWMYQNLDIEDFYRTTGVSPNSTYSLAKIMWVRENQSEVYEKTWKILLFSDFILYRLGAVVHCSPSLAARTMAFDVFNMKWAEEILAKCHIDKNLFADILPSGSIAGVISATIADELGIKSKPKLVVGGHDQVFAALGAGVIGQGIAVDGLGTTECITPVFSKPANLAAMDQSRFACVPFVFADTYVTYAYTMTSGSVLKWFRNNYVKEWYEEAEQVNLNIYDYMIERSIDRETEMLFLPHLAGTATPYMDNGSKGALIGITLDTDKEEIIKAILEGINFEMMINLERLELAGISVNELRVVGGLSKSDVFLQLKADMMGIPITRVQTHEAGTLGVALISSVAIGMYSSVEEAIKALVVTTDTFIPNDAKHTKYKKKFDRYKQVYPAVRPIV